MVRTGQRLTSRHYHRGLDGWGWTGNTTTAAAAVASPALGTLNKADLVALADKRGVDSSGTKADILARL